MYMHSDLLIDCLMCTRYVCYSILHLQDHRPHTGHPSRHSTLTGPQTTYRTSISSFYTYRTTDHIQDIHLVRTLQRTWNDCLIFVTHKCENLFFNCSCRYHTNHTHTHTHTQPLEGYVRTLLMTGNDWRICKDSVVDIIILTRVKVIIFTITICHYICKSVRTCKHFFPVRKWSIERLCVLQATERCAVLCCAVLCSTTVTRLFHIRAGQ